MTHGGKRSGAGRKPGSASENVKMGVSVSIKNAEWLRYKKSHGFNISWLVDEAIDLLRASEI